MKVTIKVEGLRDTGELIYHEAVELHPHIRDCREMELQVMRNLTSDLVKRIANGYTELPNV